MKRTLSVFLSVCLCIGLVSCAQEVQVPVSEPSEPDQSEPDTSYTFTDSLGNEITLPQSPARVAALMGSYAESWILAGGQESLAAVTQDAYDERGLELGEGVVNLGSSKSPNLEALFAVQPELVILTTDLEGQLGLADSLSDAGIPSAWFKVESFGDYLTMLEIFTNLTGRPDLYQQNGLDIQARIDQAIASVPDGVRPRVLLLRAHSSAVKARNSDNIVGVMLQELGCENIADSDSGLLEDLQMEAILAADPDIILVETMGSSTEKAMESLESLFQSDPAWQSLTAMQNDRLVILDKQLFHYKPNARWGESYETLVQILFPTA